MTKTLTQKIFEECKNGKWVCNRKLHAIGGWSPHVRQRELVNQLNRTDEKYHWYWDTPKQCNCKNAKPGVVHHRLVRIKREFGAYGKYI